MKKRGLTVLSLICAGCIGVGAAASDLIHNIKAELREDFAIVIDGENTTLELMSAFIRSRKILFVSFIKVLTDLAAAYAPLPALTA